jgi:hypothetical protein
MDAHEHDGGHNHRSNNNADPAPSAAAAPAPPASAAPAEPAAAPAEPAAPPPPPPPPQAWADLEAELALDASRREALVRAVVGGDLATVQELVEGDHALAFHTLNRKTTLLVRREELFGPDCPLFPLFWGGRGAVGRLCRLTQTIQYTHTHYTVSLFTQVLAVEHNHLPVAAYLLQRGVDVNKTSQMRLSPLHAAARLPVRRKKHAFMGNVV